MRPRRLLFALVPLLVLIVGAEGLARRLEPAAGPTPMMVPHPTRIWGLSPGQYRMEGVTVEMDADGMRVVPPSTAQRRVLTVGDSSIFGHGLPDEGTLHVQLAQALSTRGVEAEVRCGGVPGYSTEQTLKLLEEWGWDLAPSLVVVGGMWSDAQAERFTDRVWMDHLASPRGRLELLVAKSAVYRAVRRRLKPELPEALPVGWVREPTPQRHPRVSPEDYAENLERLAAESRARDVGLAVLTPCHRQRLVGTPAPWDRYAEAMRAFATQHSLPRVDACEVMRESGLGADALFLDSLHPTAEANRRYAEALSSALVQAGWPEARLLP
ncbi:SGNH/GDSL hydrolase family protein [Myxococcota bacterium]|nr:SGNH/GDSL hydrolase family protein [Myxococcota bacterium]